MFNKRGVIVALCTLVILVGCFFLPVAVADISDRTILDNLVIIDMGDIAFENNPDLELPARIRLISSSNSEHAQLKTGKNMDYNKALTTALSELLRFSAKLNYTDYTVEEAGASFVIDAEDPSLNIVVWRFRIMYPGDIVITVTLDDETGLILQLILRQNALAVRPDLEEKPNVDSVLPQTQKQMRETAQVLVNTIGDYYSIPVLLKEFELLGGLGYYNAELDNDGEAVSMFGIVRVNGFSFNE